MSLRVVWWVLVAACALAAGQDVAQDPCKPVGHNDQPLTETECLEHCGCAYCYPLGVGGNGTDERQRASGGRGGRTREKEPVVGCTDWVHRDRCVGNYSTDHDSDRCAHSRRVNRMTAIIFVAVIVGCFALCSLCAFGAWARREYCARSRATYVRVP